MSSYVRFWVRDGAVTVLNSREHPITRNVVTDDDATVYSGVVSGAFMTADAVLSALTFDDDGFSVSGREVSEVSVAMTAVDQERQLMIVSPFQAKQALDDAGMLESVELQILQSDEKTQRAWNEAIEFKRNSPTITTLAAAMNLTDEQVDALFRAAAQIEA